jgi:Fic family protein
MKELFWFMRKEKRVPLDILSCVFHFETAFIHPFMDGNGRMARLWQSALLFRYRQVFAFVPVESLVKRHQKKYYPALESADRKGSSTPLIEFMLQSIHRSLAEFISELVLPVETSKSRLDAAKATLAGTWFSRKDYLRLSKSISTATASRDLREGVDSGSLEKKGD